jgi:hypothetical protein
MLRTIVGKIARDDDYPERAFTNDVYSRVLEGALYDHLPHPFHRERTDRNSEYIPLRERRPSVRYNLCRLVVDDSVALLFSEGHFPTADCKDEATKEALAAVVKENGLNELMLNAATQGSVGSVAIWLRVLKQEDSSHRAFFSVQRTRFLTPFYSAVAPDTLVKIREQYKVTGAALKAQGYTIKADDLNTKFWFAREWDTTEEVWFMPWKVTGAPETAVLAAASSDFMPWTKDTARGAVHDLGFVPWIWVRNLPGELKLVATDDDAGLTFSDVDGGCTFAGAVEDMIEIDYLLSQAGRGLKYNMDPILLLKEPVSETPIEKGGSVAVVDENGDGKMIEIQGTAFTVVLDFAKALRDLALEQVHGNRVDTNKLSAAQSGRAMELMNQALIWLADRLRVSYGEGALLSLLKMTMRAHEKFPLTVEGKVVGKLADTAEVSLIWPNWYPPTAADRSSIATTLKTHKEARHISRETAVKTIASDYDIEDVAKEITAIEADQKAEVALLPAAKSSVTASV